MLGLVGMKYSKLLSILFIAGTLTLGLTVSQSVFASDSGGPPGGPHHNPVDDFPPGNPHVVDPDTGDTATGNPHTGNDPPPGVGDPHRGTDRGNPHLPGEKVNPRDFSPIPAHAKGIGPVGEPVANDSPGEPKFNDFPGEPVANGYAGEPKFNDFPGEPVSNDSFGES